MLTPGKYVNSTHRRAIVVLGLLVTVATSALVLALAVHTGGDRDSTHEVSSSRRLLYADGHGDPTRLRVFSRHLKVRTRFASASSLTGPSVLAGAFGRMQVYLSERKGLICIRVLEGSTESAGCAHAEEIENIGDLGVRGNGSGRIGIVLVLPNGVESVTLFDRGAGSRRIGVANNVAEAYDSQIESVAYRLANGALHTISIPAEFLHPKPPRFHPKPARQRKRAAAVRRLVRGPASAAGRSARRRRRPGPGTPRR
jgi:hypothetical protein